jgi:hypothetical protein
MTPEIPIRVNHLFHSLDVKLLELLKSLSEEEWQAQTVAKHWKVKDVVAHLLDGNLRTLSIQRDDYVGEKPENIHSYQDLVDWLNQLNADWVKASKRLSPTVLTMLHELTGKAVSDYYCSLDLHAKAIFSVAWAGEEESENWFHLSREYMEKWLHQQQIRDAVNKPGILTPEYFLPFLHSSFRALPHTFRFVEAKDGTCLRIRIDVVAEESWYLLREHQGWSVSRTAPAKPSAMLHINANAAWKLFSKSWIAADARPFIKISGDVMLAEKALSLVSFMA